MKSFVNNLSTRAKLILSFGVILALLAVVIVIAYVSMAGITQSVKVLRDVHFEMALQLATLRSHENHNRADILDMMLTSDRSVWEADEQDISKRATEIDGIIAELIALHSEPAVQSQLQVLQSELAAYRNIRDQEISLIHAGKVEEAKQLALGVGGESYEKIRSLTYDMGAAEIADVDAKLAQSQQAARSSTILFLVIGVIAVLLAIGLVAILNQTIASPLTGISQVAGQIAAGDLRVHLPEEQRRDEIGALTRAFRQMVETLRRSTADIFQSVGLLGSSASEILAATTQVASGTAETATAISETTSTVEEVRQAAQLSSQKAQYVSDSAQRVAQVSQSGQKAVQETSAGMERIREQMETIAQTVVRLSEQGQSIGRIIASVTDLADQSNLLAVNAAIEAAKAGEQGKGFAVVAQEIKSLAEQSKQATAQVRDILSDVQKATSAAVMATEQGSKAVEAGVKQAMQAGEAIQALAETSGEAAQAATQIVVSSQQQAVGMDQIGVAMENINQAGSQNATSMKQMEIAAHNLHELGQKLQELVALFKT